MAPARSSVVGNRSPAARSSRSSAAFRVLYEASPGRTVRWASVSGSGYSGKPPGSFWVSKPRPRSSSYTDTLEITTAEPTCPASPVSCRACPASNATMSTRTSQPSPTAADSAASSSLSARTACTPSGH